MRASKEAQWILRYALLVLLLCVAVGCTTPIQPQTTRQKLAVATATLTGVYNGIATLAETGQLTTTEYATLMQSADRVRSLLSAATVSLSAGDTATSEQKLLLVNRMLLELHGQLANHRGGAP